MNKLQIAKQFTQIKHLAVASCLVSLVACGGGAGVGGGSQAPDPTITEKPIAYVKRPTPMDNGAPSTGDITDPATFHPGAHLIVKMTPSLDSPEIDVTNALIGDTGDVRDPSFSDDGTKLLFALHMKDDNVDPPETWDIYEFDLTKPVGAGNPWRVMSDADAPNGDDIEPQFMTNGRIVFSSSRAARVVGIEIDEAVDTAGSSFPPTIEATNSNNHAFNIHSMTEGGTDIRQLTFNMSNDLYPTVIRYIPGLEGRILFSRWEHSPGRNQMSLYTANPDGTDVQYLYGAHSHNTGTNNSVIQFTQPRETADGKVMVLAMPFTGTYDGGDPTLIDVNQYSDNTVPVVANTGLTGPAQTSTSNPPVVTNAGFSPAGRYGSVVPLLDGTNRALVSYTLCYASVLDTTTNTTQILPCSDSRVNLSDTATTTEAPPRYGIFIANLNDGTVKPITAPIADTYLTDVAVAQDKVTVSLPAYTVDEAAADQTGILDIRSVYDLDGAFDTSLLRFTGTNTTKTTEFNALCTNVANQTDCDKLRLQYIANPLNSTGDATDNPTLIERKPQFLRIVKGVYLPDDTTRDFKTSAFGINRSQLMRQIIGYTPIDPDGSVHVKVPANVPLSISIVDRDGRRIGNRHGFWLTVRTGETVSCNGCHSPSSTAPHGRTAGQFPSINPGAASDGAVFPGTNPPSNFIVNATNTMAFVRSTYGPIGADGSQPIYPSADIVFNDIWTDSSQRVVDAPYSYTYASLMTPSPANSACTPWKEYCRIGINYEADIQPLWSVTRIAADGTTDVTCINCHNAAGAGLTPPTQLDLSNSTSDINADYFTSYEELLNTDNQVNAAGADVLSDPNDPNSTIPVNPSMSAGSAAGSTTFFAKLSPPYPGDGTTTLRHCTDNGMGTCVGWLSESELKLLSEWLDIGAQYYNNPFLAPLN
jgi:hypothetical protein